MVKVSLFGKSPNRLGDCDNARTHEDGLSIDAKCRDRLWIWQG
ncbi:MAG TPA: hypothetical protein V6D14_28855 [Coleofasciculaceae cyanobacterium]